VKQLEKQIAALVMEYGLDKVVRAAESAIHRTKAPLILLDKAQSLPMEDRAPFYQFAAVFLAKSDEDAWEACRAWDNSAACGGGAWFGTPRRGEDQGK